MTRTRLTQRQVEVLRLVANGCTNKEIAGRLDVCEQSAKEHVSRLLRRFEAPNRAVLAFRVAEMGIAAGNDGDRAQDLHGRGGGLGRA